MRALVRPGIDSSSVRVISPVWPGAGTIRQGIITVAGQQIQCMDSPVSHAFDFTPSVSLFIRCESEEEQQRVWAALSEGGSQLMPFGDYGFGPFGWCNDRFGVSWQVARA